MTLAPPADLATGDYAVTADCSTGDAATSSYDAVAVAVGTVAIAGARRTAAGECVWLEGATLGKKSTAKA